MVNALVLARQLMAFDGQDVRAANALEDFDTSPAHHHPENSWRQILMAGVQEGLRRLGYRLPRDGIADAATAAALVQLMGPRWRWMSWREIYTKLAAAGVR